MMRIFLLAIAAVALLTGSPMAADNNMGLQDPSCGTSGSYPSQL